MTARARRLRAAASGTRVHQDAYADISQPSVSRVTNMSVSMLPLDAGRRPLHVSLRLKRFLRSPSALWWLLALALLVLSAGIGLRDPWPADEPRFALIARTMIENSQWLLPQRGETLYADKPPMFMWALAAAWELTGSWRLAFLLPSMLAGMGTLVLVYDLTRRLWNRRIGVIAGFTLLTLLQFALQSKTAQIDGLLSLWTTLGLYGLLRHLLLGPDWRWYTVGFFAMGLGIITKGVGFLPALVLIPYAIAAWRGLATRPLQGSVLRWAGGPIALVAAVAIWAVPMLIAVFSSNAPELVAYRNDLLVHQTVQRYAAAWHHRHGLFFLVPQALWLWAPVTLLLPWLVPAWARRVRRGDMRIILLLGWALLVLLFFSLSPGKRGVYILPAAPALAMAAAPLIGGLLRRRDVQWLSVAVLALGTVVALAAAVAFGFTDAGSHIKMSGVRLPAEMLHGLAGGFAALGLAGLLLLWTGRNRHALVALGGLIACLWLALGWVGFPVLNPIRSTAPFMAEVGERIGPEAELGMVDWKEQYLLFADRHVKSFGYHGARHRLWREAGIWLSRGGNRWLLVNKRGLGRTCVRPDSAIDMGSRHRDHWYLAKPDSIDRACLQRLQLQPPEADVTGSETLPSP